LLGFVVLAFCDSGRRDVSAGLEEARENHFCCRRTMIFSIFADILEVRGNREVLLR